MNAKNTLIALLALTTLGGGALAWHQYQQLVDLRASSLRAGERSDLQKKIWDLQKANQELKAQLAAARSGTESGDEAVAATDRPAAEDNAGLRGPRGNRGQQFAAMRELMQKPEVQALMSTAQKGLVDSRYAALFRSLNLSPDQADKLSQLLVDRQNAVRDVMQAARDQGVNPRTDPQGFQKLVADAESPINDSIKSLIGDPGYSQLTNYDQTMPQRNVVNTLQQRLSYTDSPLSSSQADQLVQILASASPAPANATGDNGGWRGRGGPGGFGGGMMEGGGAIAAIAGPGAAQITPQAVAQAGTVLDPTQLTTLQQLQQQQQAAEQLRQLARSTWQQTSGETAATGTAPTGAPPAAAPTGTGTGGGRRGGGG